jgi:hypothetical protein
MSPGYANSRTIRRTAAADERAMRPPALAIRAGRSARWKANNLSAADHRTVGELLTDSDELARETLLE